MRHHYLHHLLVALIVLANVAAHAAPQPVQPAPVAPPPVPVPREPVREFALPALPAVQADAAQFGPAVRSDVLDAQRGGTDTVNNNMALDGSVHNNTASNVVTGSNTIDAGSFANMAGIPTVIQNTGANVLIQNATIINLQLK